MENGTHITQHKIASSDTRWLAQKQEIYPSQWYSVGKAVTFWYRSDILSLWNYECGLLDYLGGNDHTGPEKLWKQCLGVVDLGQLSSISKFTLLNRHVLNLVKKIRRFPFSVFCDKIRPNRVWVRQIGINSCARSNLPCEYSAHSWHLYS